MTNEVIEQEFSVPTNQDLLFIEQAVEENERTMFRKVIPAAILVDVIFFVMSANPVILCFITLSSIVALFVTNERFLLRMRQRFSHASIFLNLTTTTNFIKLIYPLSDNDLLLLMNKAEQCRPARDYLQAVANQDRRFYLIDKVYCDYLTRGMLRQEPLVSLGAL